MYDDRLLKTVEVAQFLGVSQATVKRLIVRGDLPSLRIGRARRVRLSELVAWQRSLPGGQ